MSVGKTHRVGSPPLWKLDQDKKPQDKKAFFNALSYLYENLEWENREKSAISASNPGFSRPFWDLSKLSAGIAGAYEVYFDLLDSTNLSGASSDVINTCKKILYFREIVFPPNPAMAEQNWVFLQWGAERVRIPKNLLIAQSDTFKRCLSWGMKESTTGIIDLTESDLSAEDFKSFIDFLKTGDSNLTQDNVFTLLHLAEKYFVTGLVRRSASFLGKKDNLLRMIQELASSQKDLPHSHTFVWLLLQFETHKFPQEVREWVLTQLKIERSDILALATMLKQWGIKLSFDYSGLRHVTLPESSSKEPWQRLLALDKQLPIESISITPSEKGELVEVDLTGSFPSLIKVTLKGLKAIKTFITPQAIKVDCEDCSVLESLRASVATGINLLRCPSVTNMHAPAVEDFECGGSPVIRGLVSACQRSDIPAINAYIALLQKSGLWLLRKNDKQSNAALLHGAYLVKNRVLLYEVIDHLCDHSRDDLPADFREMASFYSFTGIENWIASLSLEFSREDAYPETGQLHFFLEKTAGVEHLPAIFIQAIGRLDPEDRKKSFISLVHNLRTVYFSIKKFSFIFDLIKHFDFFQDPDICRIFVFTLLESAANYAYAQKKLQELGFTPEEDPLLPLVRQYLAEASAEQEKEIFKLFNIGMNEVRSHALTTLCMEVMKRLNLHHLLPYYLDVSPLIQRVASSARVQEGGHVMIACGDSTFVVPSFVIQARAPRVLPVLQAGEYPAEIIEECVERIANTEKPLDALSLPNLVTLYQIAYEAGMGVFLCNAEDKFLTDEWLLDETNISSLLEVYRVATGSFKNDFKHRLLTHACELFTKDEPLARHIVDMMRTHDPLSFEMVQVIHLLGRLQYPADFKRRSFGWGLDSCRLNADFVPVLQELVPEITKMDLTHVTLDENALFIIGAAFPGLTTLTMEVIYTNEFAHLRRLQHVEELILVGFKDLTRVHLEAIGHLPLRKLVLPVRDTKALDFIVEKPPQFVETLKSVQYPAGKAALELDANRLGPFLSLVPSLEELGLDCFIIDRLGWECIQKHAPNLRSFSGMFREASLSFFEQYPHLEQFSSRRYPQCFIKEVMPKCTSLHTLKLGDRLDGDDMATIARFHPHLKTLSLRHWDKSFLPHFCHLQELQSLDLSKSDIPFDDVVQLIQTLHLQTFSLPKRLSRFRKKLRLLNKIEFICL